MLRYLQAICKKITINQRHWAFASIFIGILAPLWSAQQLLAQQPTPVPLAPPCGLALPKVAFLGTGPATFRLDAGFETFIVKRVQPFRFVLESGTINAQGQRIYVAKADERVWSCDGNCQLPAVYHEAYEIGAFQPNDKINLVVIDDDVDRRLNYFAVNDPMTPYQVVTEQQLTEYLSFTVPVSGTWYYYAVDSIGIAATCIEPATPTPTPTITLTTTPTATLTTTPTPPTPVETATATQPATPTPPVLPTGSTTPMPTPVIPPTAIELLYFDAVSQWTAVELRWETAIELDLAGFRIWRSSDNQRQHATLITPTLIRHKGGGSTGASYTFVDQDVTPGYTYTYWLEKVRGDQSTEDLRATTVQLLGYFYLPLIQN